MNQTETHYKRKNYMRILAAVVAVLLLISICPAPHDMAQADSDGMIRVKLTRLGSSVSSITMTTVGSYTVSGTNISSGTSVKVTKSGSTLTLSSGGKQLASGSKITMSRAGGGGVGTGVRFTSPSLSNLFCGDLTFSLSGSSIQTVLSIYVETYLYGVVPYEMSNSFPLEALKAQAIAARTYAMRAKRTSGSYDVTDNTSSQVFKGYNSSYSNAISAVDGTRGVVLMSGSAYAQCYYTASNGGQTESASNAWGGSGVSYLTVKDDPYDAENPNSIVKSHSISKYPQEKALNSKLEAALIKAAAEKLDEKGLSSDAYDVTIEEIVSVVPHTPKYAEPSRAYTSLRFTMKLSSRSKSTQNKVSTEVEADLATYGTLQSMLSLSINSSDNEIISVRDDGDSFRLSFARYGHGIGMSQRGAQWMAKEYGKDYEEILSFYYPGTKQTRLSLKDMIGSGSSAAPDPTRAPVDTEDGYTTLQEGDSGSAVKALQTRLKELGYFTGTPLGNYKTLTVAAVKAYQTAMGLKADGIATPELQKMIFSQQGVVKPDEEPEAGGTKATVKLGSSSSRLNVRRAPSTSAAVEGTIKHGTEVTVLAVSGEWRKISTGSLTGYVMAKYLALEEEPEAEETPAPETDGYTTLQYGDSGEKVKQLQEKLQELGYFNGTPLGNYKTLTVAAVQAYQKAMGLEADGIATPELQQMIFEGKRPSETDQPDANEGVTATVSLGSASSRLNVRASASTTAAVVGRLRHGTKVTLLSTGGGWSRIQSGSITGYVKSSYLAGITGSAPEATATPAPEITSGTATVSLGSASSRLNVRSAASTASSIVGTLRHNTKVTVLSTSGGWSNIQTGNMSGYVKTTYLAFTDSQPSVSPEATQTPSATIGTGTAVISLSSSSSRLNVRKSATTSSAIVGTLSHNDRVTVLEVEGSWSRIQGGSLTGYVMSKYLVMSGADAEATQTPTQKPADNSEYQTLSYGDSGAAVRKLQGRLKELGYFTGELGGNYLKLTRAAVEAYQQANGWTVDGVATPELQEEIFSASAEAGGELNATVQVGSSSYLNLRKSASTASAVVKEMKNGDRVCIIGEDGDWYHLQTEDEKKGYAKKDYIRLDD